MPNVYMAIENDIYELPIAVADNVRELASILGIERHVIYEEMSRAKRHGLWCRFIKVPLAGEPSLYAIYANKKIKKETGPKKQQVIHIVNGHIVKYPSAVKAAESNGVNVSTVRRWIKYRDDWQYLENSTKKEYP